MNGITKRPFELIFVLLGIFFALQPLIIYLTAYDPGDCDDKAVHYYAAAYFQASTKDKEFINNTYKNYSQATPGGIFSKRTEFRISSAGAYPLANLFISKYRNEKSSYTDAVKYGLLAVTITAIILVLLISSKTAFGFWQTALVLNLIAFYSIKLHFIVDQVPRNMHPFITFIPRGAAALLVIPALLSLAAKKPTLFTISLLSIFLFHAGSAIIIIPPVLAAAVLFWFAKRVNLFRNKYFYLIFAPAIIGGKNTFIAAISIGCLIYVVNNLRNYKNEFYQTVFNLSSISLFLLILTASITSQQKISQFLVNSSNLQVLSEISQRLTGAQYSLLILMVVASVRISVGFALKNYISFKKKLKISQRTVIIIILLVLTLNHLSEYSWVLRRVSGFFLPTCTAVQPVGLPADPNILRVMDEPSFFVTLANYLFN